MNDAHRSTDHSPEPPRAILERFHLGAPDAIEQLADLFYADVVRFTRSMMGEEEAAMDAVQETFLRLIERHRLFDPNRLFRPWLFAVCRNTCLSLHREKSTQQARVIALEDDEGEALRLAADLPPAFEEMIRRERESEVLGALSVLPDGTREIILLHLFEGLTFREISTITGRPAATVATTYYRGLADMRRRLGSGNTDAGRKRDHAS